MTDRSYLKIPEAADELRVSRATVYRLIKRGELKAIEVGQQLRIARIEIEAFADRQAVA